MRSYPNFLSTYSQSYSQRLPMSKFPEPRLNPERDESVGWMTGKVVEAEISPKN